MAHAHAERFPWAFAVAIWSVCISLGVLAGAFVALVME
jgi:hypothetical protein